MKIANLQIGVRLGLGFALVLTLLVLNVILANVGMSQTNKTLHHIVDVNVEKITMLENMSSSVHIVTRVLRTVVLLNDKDAALTELKKVEHARQVYDAATEKLDKMPLDEAGKAFVAEIHALRNTARPLDDKVVELGLANRDKEAVEVLLKEAGPATTKWQDKLREFIELQKGKNAKDVEQAAATYEQTRLLLLGFSVIALAAGIVIAWLLTRSITVPLNQAVVIAQTVASGDLTHRIEVTSRDETGRLMQALKDMNDSLVKIVGEVRQGTDSIFTASSEIAAGNLDLSSRTEQQASSLEETASSMEELTTTVKQNSDNARQANVLSATASNVAVQGGTVVAQVVETMSSINASSKKAVDIISVIDGIAFQTNILALNAAVEAARAGEQGRGFAVVAGEVRSLAQRSAQAAKEIKTLIDDSVTKANAGAQLADQAGATMTEVVASVQRVTDIMGEISSASTEQTQGIAQINDAIAQMDQVTQQNAALVEQAAAAAEAMQDQASRLAQVVGVFKLAAGTAASGATPLRLAQG